MGKKNHNKKNKRLGIKMKQETKYVIWGIILFALGLFSIVAAFGGAGVTGEFFYDFFSYLFGIGYFLLPILLVILGVFFITTVETRFAFTQLIGAILFLLSGLGLIDVATFHKSAGVIGKIASYLFVKLFDIYIGIIFLGAILIISILVMFDKKPRLVPFFQQLWNLLSSFFEKTFQSRSIEEQEEITNYQLPITNEKEEEEQTPEEIAEEKEEMKEEKIEITEGQKEERIEELLRESTFSPRKSALPQAEYSPPPLSLLEKDKGKPNVGDIKVNSNIIKRTLINFGIEIEMDEIIIGPTVTRYAFKPAEGVKLSRIIALQNDLALALAVHPIRIEAPIPGFSLVGVEIPNKSKSEVGLATILAHEKFQKGTSPLIIALGKKLSGAPLFADLAKMPHLLIGGSTGSGKSILVHTIITSLLYRNSPENLRFILIDPKRVELSPYNKIPHLLTPVITDTKKTILSLNWAINEMERRYEILEAEKVRDILSFHDKISRQINTDKDLINTDKMPYIVIIIDELADIMSIYPRELEAAIVRLAQMSRAVGIHLILSTQRPSVNIITGLIKANISTRIALQVSSQIDSRTILDSAGAEKLLGAGDMLYLSGEMSKPERIQGAFIREMEVKKVVDYIALHNQSETDTDEVIEFESAELTQNKSAELTLGDKDDDELYREAKETVIRAGKASTSYLQRKLRIGYARAARIMDMLEERGIVRAQEGSRPREVLEKLTDNSQPITDNDEEE